MVKYGYKKHIYIQTTKKIIHNYLYIFKNWGENWSQLFGVSWNKQLFVFLFIKLALDHKTDLHFEYDEVCFQVFLARLIRNIRNRV
jgi:hypothetical protein